MHLTHNTGVVLLWLVVFASGGLIGGLIAWWRLSYRLDECCDCCTCETCEPDEGGPEFRLAEGYCYGCGSSLHLWSTCPENPARSRRTILLEPGPTIYPALAALPDEPVHGPERPAKASESTWYRTTWLDLERRYPIHQDSPTGALR